MHLSGRFINSVVVAATAIALWGCGTANDKAPQLDSAGKHPASWLTNHGTSYLARPSLCKECHGDDHKGGIARISCFSASVGAQGCHATGPHPVPWPGHNNAATDASACTLCHGVGLSGGARAPACSRCHTLLTAGAVPVPGSCTSCHGTPPGGALFPNISGAHRKHTQLAGSASACATCHNGAGTGTPAHGTQSTAIVSFLATFNGKSGTAQIDARQTCSNISCHGGIQTPPWRSGRIDVKRNCRSCHVAGSALQSPQFNSYYSGEHSKHLSEVGLDCIDCHDMTVTSNGAAHFSGLNTPAIFELEPRLTIRGALNYTRTGTSGSCAPGRLPAAGTFSVGICHGSENWQ